MSDKRLIDVTGIKPDSSRISPAMTVELERQNAILSLVIPEFATANVRDRGALAQAGGTPNRAGYPETTAPASRNGHRRVPAPRYRLSGLR